MSHEFSHFGCTIVWGRSFKFCDQFKVTPNLSGATFGKFSSFFLTKLNSIIWGNIFHENENKILKRARVIGKKRFSNKS